MGGKESCKEEQNWVGSSVAEPEPVELKLFWDLEMKPELELEPKINFNKHFLQSVWRMLE